MERIGDDVGRELRRFGVAGDMAEIVTAWSAAVGEAIARNAWPARLARDGTLHVSTASSAWAFELTQLVPELLARLGEVLGAAAPRALRFAPGRLPEPATAEQAGQELPVLPRAEDVELAQRVAAGIDNDELRALVARAAAASLARAASGRSF